MLSQINIAKGKNSTTSYANHGFSAWEICHMLQNRDVKMKNKYHIDVKHWETKHKHILTMNVSLNDAKIWATQKTCSPSLTAGPRVTFSSFGSLVFLFDDCRKYHHHAHRWHICSCQRKCTSLSRYRYTGSPRIIKEKAEVY